MLPLPYFSVVPLHSWNPPSPLYKGSVGKVFQILPKWWGQISLELTYFFKSTLMSN